MSDIGHNSGIAAEQLRSFIERAERLHEERKGLADDLRDLFAEARGVGFDVKAIKQILKIRGQDHAERQEAEAILETYLSALGMV